MESYISNILLDVINKAEIVINTMTSTNQNELYKFEPPTSKINEIIVEAIKVIIGSNGLIKQISNRSYFHDNGFIKLVLLQTNKTIAETRIHLWGVNDICDLSDKFNGNIHDHSANFASYILKGSLKEEIYSLVNNNQNSEVVEANEYDCSSRGEEDYYTMNYKGLKHITCISSKTFFPGEWHSLQSDVLHRAYPIVKPTVTLFFQSPRNKRGTKSLDTSERNWSVVVQSKPLSEEDTYVYLVKTLSLLQV